MFDSISEFPDVGSRRHFLRVAMALTTGTTFAGTAQAAGDWASAGAPQAKEPPTMRIGILAGTFTAHFGGHLGCGEGLGVDCIQLSMDRAGLSPMPNEVPAELSGRIRREAAAAGSRSLPCRAPSTCAIPMRNIGGRACGASRDWPRLAGRSARR